MMVYIYDLHYSHKDQGVLALLEANSIIPIFIPAGCTDLHQVCDVCINKPYKNGVAAEFIDTISNKYNDWQSSRSADDDNIFRVNLSTGETKPLIPAYVTRGISSIKTPAMKESIAKCFQKEGLLSEARLAETYQRALLVLTEAIVIPEEVEIEEDLGPIEEIEDGQTQAVGLEFDIEVNRGDNKDQGDNSSSDGEDDDEEADEEMKAPDPPKRQRKENTMIGVIRKGKYSK